ncbi:MAG: alkaline phosphatase family protein [Candidatus Aminicenantes bacterium]|nr:alkaline phosphatase family protein [Candidatus Aminicenantes bacterium]
MDGADGNIIDPLAEKGKLPNLARLIKAGSSGVFYTFRPTKSPVIGTSIATGKTMTWGSGLGFR